MFTSFLRILLPTLTSATSLSWGTYYSDPNTSTNTIACSDGIFGLATAGYPTLSALPSWPHVAAIDAISGWNDADCGSCWNVTFPQTGKSVLVTGVDISRHGFVMSKQALDNITFGLAEQLGKVEGMVARVGKEKCGL